jgi:hypothetical protein
MTRGEAIKHWDDLATEEEVKQKTGYSTAHLRRLRNKGFLIKGEDWYTLKGRKLLYRKSSFIALLGIKGK